MTSVAFLGLGRMGALMARRLVDAGHDLAVWNRTPGKADALVAAGAREAGTPAEAVAGAEVVVTMLADPQAVREVLLGAGPGLQAGALVVEMSTIGPAAVAALRDELPEGVRLVDAPVQGSLPQAQAGKLNIFLGAADEDAVVAKEVLERLGTVKHVGGPGTGAALKIVVNGMTVSAFAAMGEALRLADRLGVDADDALDALSGTAVGPLATRVKQRLAEADTPTQFGLGLAEKDLRLALEAGAVVDGVTAAAQRALAAAVADGLAQSDVSGVVRHMRRSAPGA
ncbi:NAD(P)-dependent oxidoreductase [Streptomyces sp. NPDC004549]|uniref:NAD(P)-dependent oxidoreductase n=1 Tax=Streptomyces sp. NPDC004549 TaxID=3154283 RepID=UPI0033B2E17E